MYYPPKEEEGALSLNAGMMNFTIRGAGGALIIRSSPAENKEAPSAASLIEGPDYRHMNA